MIEITDEMLDIIEKVKGKRNPALWDPRCKELIKALRTLTYAPNTGLPNKNLGVDHAFDAFGYLCLQQFNLAKPETLGQTSFRIY